MTTLNDLRRAMGTYKDEDEQKSFQSEDSILPSPDPLPIQEIEPGSYSQDDLTDDKYFGSIERYMQKRFGVDEYRNYSKEEVVNKFLNNMRGFSGGNSTRAINEVAFLNSLGEDEEQLAAVGEAYALFENMAGVFSEETTRGEKAEAIGDYVRSTVLDPINLVGFGIGKLFTASGSKVGSKVAQRTALQAYKKMLRKGATKKAAEKVSNRVWKNTFNQVAKDNAVKLAAKREAIEKAPDTIRGRLTSGVAKEVSANLAVEAAVNIGSAYAYEKGLVRTDVQEEINKVNVGLAAVGTLIIGGIRFAPIALRSNKNVLVKPSIDVKEPQSLDLSEAISSVPFTSSLKEKAARGIELQDLDTDFFITMLLGDSDNGVKGLAEIMVEQGYSYIKRNPEDSVSNFVADVIKKSDPQDAAKFIEEFKNNTGITMVELTDKVSGKTSKQDIDIKSFSDIFAKKISDQGRLLNAMSQVQKKLNLDDDTIKNMTASDTAAALLSIGEYSPAKNKEVKSWFGKANQSVVDVQKRIIRLLVTSPSTSYLNMVGYGSAAGINTVTDAGMALTYLGQSGLYKVLGKNKEASESLRIFRQLKNAQGQRLKNLLDTEMTYDAYMSIAQKDPKALEQLTQVMAGGVDVEDAVKKMGVDPEATIIGMRADQGIEFLQKVNFVVAQDVFTKSQEFVYQLDKGLRVAYDKSWNEFFNHEGAAKAMNSKQYQDIVAKAVFETQKATFAVSYKDAGFVPKIIEEARDVAGIGLLVPFGRFFNNTLAFTADSTGLTFATKLLGAKSISSRSTRELGVRGAVGLTTIVTLAQNETLNRELGLSWDERIDPETGGVRTEKYNFPLSHFKALGRFFSYALDDMEMPPEELTQILEILGPGQITRQLNQITDGLGDLTMTAITEFGTPQGDRALKDLVKPIQTITSQAMSGSTRFLDPINSAVGLARGSDFKMVNRKIGSETLNNSLRYMDQIIAVVSGKDISEEQFTGATGKIRSDASKQVGYREVTMTDTKKVLSMVGRPTYLANLKTKDPSADNRYNQIFHDIVENMSSDLLRTPGFREGDPKKQINKLKIRQKLVKDLFKDAKDLTITLMERGVKDLGDMQLAKLIEVGSKYKWSDIDRAVEKVAQGTEFKDLTLKQLDLIQGYLDYEKQRLERF